MGHVKCACSFLSEVEIPTVSNSKEVFFEKINRANSVFCMIKGATTKARIKKNH